MYSEELRMPGKLMPLLASVFAVPVAVLRTLLVLAQPTVAGSVLLGASR